MHSDFNKYVEFFTKVKGLPEKSAQDIAHRAVALYHLLKEGEVTFSYIKQNGQVRIARGTLMPSKLDQLTFANTGRHVPDGNIGYFDLDKNEWRSFNAERLLTNRG